MIAALRGLLARATPGPWEWSTNADGYPVELTALGVGVLRPGIAVGPSDGGLCAFLTNDGDSAEMAHPDFDLIVSLVNGAPRLMALVDAVAAYKAADDECGRSLTSDVPMARRSDAKVAMLAALAALDGTP